MKLILMLILAASITSCSLLLPYSETFTCNVPEGLGYCGSVTDVYEYSIRGK